MGKKIIIALKNHVSEAFLMNDPLKNLYNNALKISVFSLFSFSVVPIWMVERPALPEQVPLV
jgi:hypothetical protein